MPRSKRDKKVSLTKVKKKTGLALKQKFIESINNLVTEFENIFVFEFEKMPNEKLKEMKSEWRPSKFVIGKNRLLLIALGKNKESEASKNLHKLSKRIVGQCGLLFTNEAEGVVMKWFADYSRLDFARPGTEAKETVSLPEGPLEQFPHSIEPYLRQLGMPTSLNNGVVTLTKEYTVCQQGKILKPEQTKILKLLGRKTTEFKMQIKCMWSKSGKFKSYSKSGEPKKSKKSVSVSKAVESADVEMKEDASA
ncbi:mRNA turnover protein 4 homolog [Bacillus rossius redtenbacheri]|uniref:mRNA turnover protein 4 homolog n=1 Tax=Bacillus rossius redtenbacheri TaxID=93214 RepID=UPI002FDE5E47